MIRFFLTVAALAVLGVVVGVLWKRVLAPIFDEHGNLIGFRGQVDESNVSGAVVGSTLYQGRRVDPETNTLVTDPEVERRRAELYAAREPNLGPVYRWPEGIGISRWRLRLRDEATINGALAWNRRHPFGDGGQLYFEHYRASSSETPAQFFARQGWFVR